MSLGPYPEESKGPDATQAGRPCMAEPTLAEEDADEPPDKILRVLGHMSHSQNSLQGDYGGII